MFYSYTFYVIILSLFSLVSCQILKVIINVIIHREISLRALLSSGGMPSSHTSTVVTLTTSLAIFQLAGEERALNYTFAVALAFSIIIIYDAIGVRQEAGRHAKVLNNLVGHKSDEAKKELGFKKAKLKELIGHKPTEVFVGFLYGLAVAFIGAAIIL